MTVPRWILLVLVCLGSGCSQRPVLPPIVTVVGVQHQGEYPFGQVIKPQISVVSPVKTEVETRLNGQPYVQGTPIVEPGHYILTVFAKAKGSKDPGTVLPREFWILAPVDVRLLRWSYRPHQTGYADVEAEFLVSSSHRAVSVGEIDFSTLELNLWVESGSNLPKLYTLVPRYMILLKNRKTQRVEAALIGFKTLHSSREVKAGKVLSQSPHQPNLKGEARFRWRLNRFREPVSLIEGENRLLTQQVKKQYAPAPGVIGALGQDDRWYQWAYRATAP
ncbi:hypothetical protein DCOP10_119244 [Armatimonadetes bacterium DC]|nr:hypothetical protein DCOP10_119244 [Armatimonadetes bacterium DC]